MRTFVMIRRDGRERRRTDPALAYKIKFSDATVSAALYGKEDMRCVLHGRFDSLFTGFAGARDTNRDTRIDYTRVGGRVVASAQVEAVHAREPADGFARTMARLRTLPYFGSQSTWIFVDHWAPRRQ